MSTGRLSAPYIGFARDFIEGRLKVLGTVGRGSIMTNHLLIKTVRVDSTSTNGGVMKASSPTVGTLSDTAISSCSGRAMDTMVRRQ